MLRRNCFPSHLRQLLAQIRTRIQDFFYHLHNYHITSVGQINRSPPTFNRVPRRVVCDVCVGWLILGFFFFAQQCASGNWNLELVRAKTGMGGKSKKVNSVNLRADFVHAIRGKKRWPRRKICKSGCVWVSTLTVPRVVAPSLEPTIKFDSNVSLGRTCSIDCWFPPRSSKLTDSNQMKWREAAYHWWWWWWWWWGRYTCNRFSWTSHPR